MDFPRAIGRITAQSSFEPTAGNVRVDRSAANVRAGVLDNMLVRFDR
jgi:hypothetical protein